MARRLLIGCLLIFSGSTLANPLGLQTREDIHHWVGGISRMYIQSCSFITRAYYEHYVSRFQRQIIHYVEENDGGSWDELSPFEKQERVLVALNEMLRVAEITSPSKKQVLWFMGSIGGAVLLAHFVPYALPGIAAISLAAQIDRHVRAKTKQLGKVLSRFWGFARGVKPIEHSTVELDTILAPQTDSLENQAEISEKKLDRLARLMVEVMARLFEQEYADLVELRGAFLIHLPVDFRERYGEDLSNRVLKCFVEYKQNHHQLFHSGALGSVDVQLIYRLVRHWLSPDDIPVIPETIFLPVSREREAPVVAEIIAERRDEAPQPSVAAPVLAAASAPPLVAEALLLENLFSSEVSKPSLFVDEEPLIVEGPSTIHPIELAPEPGFLSDGELAVESAPLDEPLLEPYETALPLLHDIEIPPDEPIVEPLTLIEDAPFEDVSPIPMEIDPEHAQGNWQHMVHVILRLNAQRGSYGGGPSSSPPPAPCALEIKKVLKPPLRSR